MVINCFAFGVPPNKRLQRMGAQVAHFLVPRRCDVLMRNLRLSNASNCGPRLTRESVRQR
jgi:hypothetical protein